MRLRGKKIQKSSFISLLCIFTSIPYKIIQNNNHITKEQLYQTRQWNTITHLNWCILSMQRIKENWKSQNHGHFGAFYRQDTCIQESTCSTKRWCRWKRHCLQLYGSDWRKQHRERVDHQTHACEPLDDGQKWKWHQSPIQWFIE